MLTPTQFECFLPPEQCGKTFLTPKKRRLHLVEKHCGCLGTECADDGRLPRDLLLQHCEPWCEWELRC